MKRLNVLIACEESQAVCIEFRRLGHRAFSCDLQACSGGHPEWHIQGDALALINGNCTFTTADTHTHTQSCKWDILIAHPPCTYLTSGGAVRLFQEEKKEFPRYGIFQMTNLERLRQGIMARDLFLAFLRADCDRIAVENPVPMSVYALPEESQIIQPYQFGDPFMKKTCLWLKRLPQLRPTRIVTPEISWVSGGSKKADGTPRENQGMKFRDSLTKSKTFPGIAKAMAEQWSAYVLDAEEYDIVGEYAQYKLF